MNNDKPETVQRRSLMGGLGAVALAGVAMSATSASAQQRPGGFQPERHAIDAWMDEVPGSHRVFIDTANGAGGTDAQRYAANILNIQASAYQGSDADIAMIICYRHMSTPFGFNDAMWEKYGDTLSNFAEQKDKDGKPLKKNPQLSAIEGLAKRGVKIAVCNAATTFMSQMLAKQSGARAEDVLAELKANAVVPAAHFVPAGVIAVTRAQEYGYSLLYSA